MTSTDDTGSQLSVTHGLAPSRPRLGQDGRAVPMRLRMAFLRAIIWSLIGMIYAPLFVGSILLMEGAIPTHWAYLIAAIVAGSVGAVLYGARELALISTGVGASLGVLLLMFFGDRTGFIDAVIFVSLIAGAIGLTVPFPMRCSHNVPGKALAGLMAGLLTGLAVTLAAPLHPEPFSVFAIVTFMVSVNGVLYVVTVRQWVRIAVRWGLNSQPCFLIEALVMAILAAVAAGSVWMVTGPLLNVAGGSWVAASIEMHHVIQDAVLGGLIGGAMAGLLLELFGFSWVHDL